MNIYLIRHAKAGHRLAGYQDRYRPLNSDGLAHSSRIAKFFLDKDIDHIISSPAARCQQTVEALSLMLTLPINESDALWEDALPTEIIELMDSSSDNSTVLCSHGNLIPIVISMLCDSGTVATGRGGAKGSIWWIQGEPKNWATATYLSPEEFMSV